MPHVSLRSLFLEHVAQTSSAPMGLEVVRAEGIYLYLADGRRVLDLVSGVSVSSVGHGHPRVVAAVQQQAAQYMHLMVYGEYVQSPQVLLAQRLCAMLPPGLQSVYFVNSGSEASEGALKLAKRYTRRPELACFAGAYHGSTQGALSVAGSDDFRRTFLPLLPGVRTLPFNSEAALAHITERTACAIVEPTQAEAGVVAARREFLQQLRARCTEVGALLIFDEVQTGLWRTGSAFAFEPYGVAPDVLTLGKAFGGGMPLGAFVASRELMGCLASPALGHITTFGGHPVSCAAGLAALEVLEEEKELPAQVRRKGARFAAALRAHPAVRTVRGEGLLLAVELGSAARVQRFMRRAAQRGLAIDWFLFCDTAFRIAPPLTITEAQVGEACATLLECLTED
ncbi:MAG: aspartate aminotransferase family protein [Prevotellaceae bacterium]|jgi:acetylornithine/succinyldiaminopimelate/putrescine aminotransferase|nr:aspartate aminotransferase family protein [Prevotellaceae bacterium]